MIIQAIKLDEHQKSLLVNKQLAPSHYFYPQKDKNGDWVITVQEQQSCINPSFWWLKDLESFETEIIDRPI